VYVKLFQKFSSVNAGVPSRFFPADAGALSTAHAAALSAPAATKSLWKLLLKQMIQRLHNAGGGIGALLKSCRPKKNSGRACKSDCPGQIENK
jgi:hypothetical protein